MKISNNTAKPRKIMAVLGDGGNSFFIEGYNNNTFFIDVDGLVSVTNYSTLEEFLKAYPDRTPLYEGDSITITF